MAQRPAGARSEIQGHAANTAGSEVISYRWGQALFGVAALLAVVMLVWPFLDLAQNNDHYVYLARHLVRGDLTVDDLPAAYRDYVLWGGHKYLPFGPFPAVVTIPFLPLLDAGLPMVWLGYAFTLLNVWLLHAVLARAGVVGERRLWVLLLFFGGTVYYSVALVGISTYFAHIVCVTFLLLAVREMLGKERLPLVGLYLGLAAMTRLTAVFALAFFVWVLWQRGPDGSPPVRETAARPRLARLGLLALGLAVPLLALGAYNYLRFGSPLESGYALAALYHDFHEQARAQGLFSIVHVPKNLFFLLLQGPLPYPSEEAAVLQFPYLQPSPWGMGIFFTSPALLYIFRARLKEPLVQACWLGVLAVIVPVITYYGIGYVQFGYRYALDFMPFLLLLAALGLPTPLSVRARVLVLLSVVVNLWGAIILSMWL